MPDENLVQIEANRDPDSPGGDIETTLRQPTVGLPFRLIATHRHGNLGPISGDARRRQSLRDKPYRYVRRNLGIVGQIRPVEEPGAAATRPVAAGRLN